MSETTKVAKWVPARVKLHLAAPHGMVPAREAYKHPDAAGLAVTREEFGGGWTVTHVPSGWAVGRTEDAPRIHSREEAERFALALAPLTDWTRGMDDVMADKPTLAPLVNRVRGAVFGFSVWEDSDAD